jgi:hypothetical protein
MIAEERLTSVRRRDVEVERIAPVAEAVRMEARQASGKGGWTTPPDDVAGRFSRRFQSPAGKDSEKSVGRGETRRVVIRIVNDGHKRLARRIVDP